MPGPTALQINPLQSIPRISRHVSLACSSKLWVFCLLCLGFVWPASISEAQESEDRSSRFWGMMDRDGDGELSGEELDRIPGFLRGRLEESGIDLSRPVSREDFSGVMDQLRRQREESGGGFGGPPGGFGGPPGGFGGRSGDERSEGGRSRDRGSDRGKKSEVPKYDFARTLPDDYKALDLDSDQQISFAEWPRSRRADFASYDHNGDGFITPIEIRLPAFVTKTADEIVTEAMATRIIGGAVSSSGGAANVASASAALATTTGSDGRERGSRDRGSRGGAPSPGGPPGDDPVVAEAKGYFDRLDTNKNGMVDPEEWSVSKRLKPLFEKAGADLSKPLNLEDFTASYRKTK